MSLTKPIISMMDRLCVGVIYDGMNLMIGKIKVIIIAKENDPIKAVFK